MSKAEEVTANKQPEEVTANNPVERPAVDVENQGSGASFSVSEIVRRWKRDDLMKKGSMVLRGLALLFSLLSFIIMATNNHGDWKNFNKYEEYRYLLAIAILSTLYTEGQVFKHIREIWTGKMMFQRRTSAMLDFFGDQVMSYLLISAASTAVPLTNRMREGQDNLFTDSSAAAISMAFLAFFALGLSALVSGYKLSSQSYI